MSRKIYTKTPSRANPEKARGLLAAAELAESVGRRPVRGSALIGALVAGGLLLGSCSARSGREAAPDGPTTAHPAASTTTSARTPNVGDAARSSAQQPGQPARRIVAPTGAYVSFVTGTVTASPPPPSPRSTGTAASPSSSADHPATAASGRSSSSGATTREVRIADAVLPGETLTSRKSSAVEVRIGNDFVVGLGEESSVQFTAVGNRRRNSKPVRVSLRLRKGSLQIKAGAQLILGTPPTGGSSARTSSRRLLLEVHTPGLFISSRGGSFLVTSFGDSTLCAVGVGRAWILPESVVYSDLIDTVADPEVVNLLDGILTKAVPVSRHRQLSVTNSQLRKVDKAGSAIRELLSKYKDEKQFPLAVRKNLSDLAASAADEIQSAIGKPGPLSSSLTAELDPASISHPKMKTTSDTQSSSTGPAPVRRQKQSTEPVAQSPQEGTGKVSTQNSRGSGSNHLAAPSTTTTSGADSSEGFPEPTPPTPPTPPVAPRQ